MDESKLQIVNPAGNLMLTHLFQDRIASAKVIHGKNEAIFKRMRITQALEEKVKNFIRLNPGSIVTVGVIEEDHRNPHNLDYSVTVKNFKSFDNKGLPTEDSDEPEEFLLVINQTWDDCDIYQYSSDGTLIKEERKRW